MSCRVGIADRNRRAGVDPVATANDNSVAAKVMATEAPIINIERTIMVVKVAEVANNAAVIADLVT